MRTSTRVAKNPYPTEHRRQGEWGRGDQDQWEQGRDDQEARQTHVSRDRLIFG